MTDPDSRTDAGAESERESDGAPDLSPSVRRLIRQYNVDVSTITGSGPNGRLRPSDILGLAGGRLNPAAEADAVDVPLDQEAEAGLESRADRHASPAPGSGPAASPVPDPGVPAATLVFECDVTRMLSHRKVPDESAEAASLTSYCVLAASRSLHLLGPGFDAGGERCIDLSLGIDDSGLTRVALGAQEPQSLESIERQLPGHTGTDDGVLRARAAPAGAELLIRHHGLAGSVVELPATIDNGRAASLGIGCVRRVVGVKSVDGRDTPRIIAQCYLSFSYDPARVDRRDAGRFLAECARQLEAWPADPSG